MDKNVSYSKIVWAGGGFFVGMVLLLFGGSFVQYTWGMWGLVLTEIGILAFAVLSALASRLDLRDVFRIRLGKAYEWRGCLYIYLGTFFFVFACSTVLSALFPQVSEVSQELSGFITSVSYIFALIAVSILPGICEEAWHRGTLLSSLASIRSVAARVLIMGLVFGLFHLDPTRFLPTMLLGMGLSYMRIKTDNMLMPMVFHAINNLFSLSVSFLVLPVSKAAETQAQAATPHPTMYAVTIGAFCLFSLAIGTLFVFLGRRRLNTVPAGTVSWYSQKLSPPTGSPLIVAPSAALFDTLAQKYQTEERARKKTTTLVLVCSSLALLSCIACFGASILGSLGTLP